MQDVAAQGADEEPAPEHIGGAVPVGDVLTVHQLDHGDPQDLGQRLEQGDVRQTLGGLPFGDGLTADPQLLGQRRLGHVPGLPELFDGGSGDVVIHGDHFLS